MKTLRLTSDVQNSAALLSVLECARDNGIARIVCTFRGERIEIDRSDEIAEAQRQAWLRSLN